jgi:hypothetical protein
MRIIYPSFQGGEVSGTEEAMAEVKVIETKRRNVFELVVEVSLVDSPGKQFVPHRLLHLQTGWPSRFVVLRLGRREG